MLVGQLCMPVLPGSWWLAGVALELLTWAQPRRLSPIFSRVHQQGCRAVRSDGSAMGHQPSRFLTNPCGPPKIIELHKPKQMQP